MPKIADTIKIVESTNPNGHHLKVGQLGYIKNIDDDRYEIIYEVVIFDSKLKSGTITQYLDSVDFKVIG